jgi:hypothetical protein
LYKLGIEKAKTNILWRQMTENEAYGDSIEYIELLLTALSEELNGESKLDNNNIVQKTFQFSVSIVTTCQSCHHR